MSVTLVTRLPRAQRFMVAAVCQYEAIAIATGGRVKLPTITRLCHLARVHPRYRYILLAVYAWLTYHLFTEGD